VARRRNNEKDYYSILGVTEAVAEDELKRVYRRLALQYHPDKNPGDRKAEEQFKEISEAYAVLIDQQKRRQYDQYRRAQASSAGATGGFRYSQDEIFRDLVANPDLSSVFQDMKREFAKAGIRFDDAFVRQVFFGGRGFIFGGVFVGAPLGVLWRRASRMAVDQGQGRSRAGPAAEGTDLIGPPSGGILGTVVRAVKRAVNWVMGTVTGGLAHSGGGMNLRYHVTITTQEAAAGVRKRIAFMRGDHLDELMVTIPPGIRSGTRLRLKGKGLEGDSGARGDLYLRVTIR
jgi:DnaJ-class molecular chaperone